MRLAREVRHVSSSRAPIAVASIGIVAMVTSSLIATRLMTMFGQSYEDVALATVNQYAYEAYPAWRAKQDAGCPPRLEVLNVHMTNKDIKDPWGNDYELYCGTHGIVVRSLGDDGIRNTTDDVWSH